MESRKRNRKERQELGYESRRWIWWAVGIAPVLVVAWIILSTLGVFGSVATAPGRVVADTMRTENIINSYNGFYRLQQRYQSRLGDIENQKSLMAEETDEAQQRINRTNLLAMRSACRDLTTTYNANAERLTSSLFRDWRLPQSLNVETCNA